jgi:hypothetical protein
MLKRIESIRRWRVGMKRREETAENDGEGRNSLAENLRASTSAWRAPAAMTVGPPPPPEAATCACACRGAMRGEGVKRHYLQLSPRNYGENAPYDGQPLPYVYRRASSDGDIREEAGRKAWFCGGASSRARWRLP